MGRFTPRLTFTVDGNFRDDEHATEFMRAAFAPMTAAALSVAAKVGADVAVLPVGAQHEHPFRNVGAPPDAE